VRDAGAVQTAPHQPDEGLHFRRGAVLDCGVGAKEGLEGFGQELAEGDLLYKNESSVLERNVRNGSPVNSLDKKADHRPKQGRFQWPRQAVNKTPFFWDLINLVGLSCS
jgi:hypothetical protein